MRQIKLVIWDLDNTLWKGVLMHDNVEPKPEVIKIIEKLDERGVLNSIASRNSESFAMNKLTEEMKIIEYFVSPMINWGYKSDSILQILTVVNILPENTLFVDDSEFELQEVKNAFPDIMILNADRIDEILDMVDTGTTNGQWRRIVIQQNIERMKDSVNVDRLTFLKSCNVKLEIHKMRTDEGKRVQELINRTNQLNIFLNRYDDNQFKDLVKDYDIIVAYLSDRYGDYGLIGVCSYIRLCADKIYISNLVISCRAMNRGVEESILSYLHNKFVYITLTHVSATSKNQMFVDKIGKMIKTKQVVPEWIKLTISDKLK